MVGGEKSVGKALLLDSFLRYLGPQSLQTQALLFEKEVDVRSPPFMVVCEQYTDRQADRLNF